MLTQNASAQNTAYLQVIGMHLRRQTFHYLEHNPLASTPFTERINPPNKAALKTLIRACTLILFLIISTTCLAGGSTFEIKVIAFNKSDGTLVFEPLSTPYGSDLQGYLDGNKKITLILNFGCHKSLYSCLTRKRVFDKADHEMALHRLEQIALPGRIIKLGVLGAGFFKHEEKAATYVSSGLVLIEDMVYSYENPFL